jgi:hypothetical protein
MTTCARRNPPVPGPNAIGAGPGAPSSGSGTELAR